MLLGACPSSLTHQNLKGHIEFTLHASVYFSQVEQYNNEQLLLKVTGKTISLSGDNASTVPTQAKPCVQACDMAVYNSFQDFNIKKLHMTN